MELPQSETRIKDPQKQAAGRKGYLVRKAKGDKRALNTSLSTPIGKYFLARNAGYNKKKSQQIAGFADTAHASRIEKTDTYKAIVAKYYKDEVLDQISLRDIAREHVKNILQDKDLGAKNKAIQMAVERIEPEAVKKEEPERVMVILKDSSNNVIPTPQPIIIPIEPVIELPPEATVS